MLDRLGEGSQSPGGLAAELASIPTLADTPNLTKLVNTILDEFSVNGLAEAVHA